ncbi:MAG: GNAT family N-acetyltransferase [Firmicutes bacterium]|nr:GNAT family N-acetyltransferase [Bacillota bacterium]
MQKRRIYKATPQKKPCFSLDIRKAAISDLPAILQMFQKAIQHLNALGIDQWDEVYPSPEIHEKDIQNGSLYLCRNGDVLAATFVVNQECDPAYKQGAWQYETAAFRAVHRLCVNPAFQNMGVGAQAMLAAETLLQRQGIESIRLDAFSQNPAALKLYEKLGYAKTGEVHFRKGLFFLFEKKL